MILPSAFTIRKTGNLYQSRHKDFGTVFQSHIEKSARTMSGIVLRLSIRWNCRITAVIMNVCALASSEN